MRCLLLATAVQLLGVLIADLSGFCIGKTHSVIVDFTALEKVNAQVTVINILGQQLASVHHTQNDMLKLDLPVMASQFCVVVVR